MGIQWTTHIQSGYCREITLCHNCMACPSWKDKSYVQKD